MTDHLPSSDSTAAVMSALQQERIPHDLLIGTAWRPSGSGARFPVDNPSDGAVLGTVADATVADGLAAMDAAAGAAAAWAATQPRARAEILRRCFDLMIERVEWFAALIAIENGKTLADARGEVRYAAEFFRWNSEEAVRISGEFSRSPTGDYTIVVDHQPVGVAILVTPWNFPAAMATRKIAPALAAGCTCVLKPAAETPYTALAIAALMQEAGVPPGVVNVVPTTQAGPVVDAMMHHPAARMVSFTGSTRVGQILLKAAADNVLKCAMELGGNAPFVVLADADLDAAIEGAMVAKMRNGGQACTAANRFIVHERLYEPFCHKITAAMAALTVGPGTDPDSGCGPLISRTAVDKVDRLVKDAVDKGARLLTGGYRPNLGGSYYAPTVLADLPTDARIRREEIFGPVVAALSFATDEEAVRLANDTEFGLVAYLYTADKQRGMSLATKFESGMLALNRGLVSDPAAPFGGVKQSGLGREGGKHGILEYLEPRYVATSF